MVDIFRSMYKLACAARGIDLWLVQAVGAADVAASGFVVSSTVWGAKGVVAVRTAEGLIKVTVPRGYPSMGGIAIMDDSTTTVGLAIVTDPTNDSFAAGSIGFKTGTRDVTFTPTDADNGRIWFLLWGKGASS